MIEMLLGFYNNILYEHILSSVLGMFFLRYFYSQLGWFGFTDLATTLVALPVVHWDTRLVWQS